MSTITNVYNRAIVLHFPTDKLSKRPEAVYDWDKIILAPGKSINWDGPESYVSCGTPPAPSTTEKYVAYYPGERLFNYGVGFYLHGGVV